MYIYIVQPGDTIASIANAYGVSPERLALENDLSEPANLTLGEALLILQPSITYIVQRGDTLESISLSQQTDILELLRNNPWVSDRGLYIGEEIVIRYADTRTATIEINGFTYPFIDKEVLIKALPYLTYLSVYAYQVTRNGSLMGIDDSEVVRLARSYGVAPIMFITATPEGNSVDTEIAHILITNMEVQKAFIDNLLLTLGNKGYYGINIDTPYIQPLDRQPYVEFINTVTKRLNQEGYMVSITIAPSTFEAATGITYEGVDYIGLSRAANSVLYQLTYEWKAPSTLPISVLPFDAVLNTINKAVIQLTPQKSILGFTIIGYLWEFPYFAAITAANFINYFSAIELANDTGSVIQFNDPSQTSYFRYIEDNKEYIAWFKDIRTLRLFISYAQNLGMQGFSVWNVMYFITNTWLLINSQYDIKKLVI